MADNKDKDLITVTVKTENAIEISVDEYTRLKDIETRFVILKEQMLKADYCPIHQQIILGIENEYAKQHVLKNPLES